MARQAKVKKSEVNLIKERLDKINHSLTYHNQNPLRKDLPWPMYSNLNQVCHNMRRMLALPLWRKSVVAPVGYKVDPENKYWLLPDEWTFKCLLQAKKYLAEGHPIREVANWLQKDCNVRCSKSSLHQVMAQCRPLDLIAEHTTDERERIFQSAPFDYYSWGEEREKVWQAQEAAHSQRREAFKRELEDNLEEGWEKGRIPNLREAEED